MSLICKSAKKEKKIKKQHRQPLVYVPLMNDFFYLLIFERSTVTLFLLSHRQCGSEEDIGQHRAVC